ncbi:MAG: S41 family peptidase [Candidatus Omnitrophota bacterium]
MKFKSLILFLSLLTLCAIANGNETIYSENVYFTSTPTLSPDAKKIAFSCEGDIWIVDADGGNALRLTAMDGDETNPRFSPDGKWLAFTGSQNGSRDVYVMPVGGGEIKQLTFHEAADIVDSWSWDSQYIYFTSDRYNNFTSYKVNRDGGTPKRLFGNYFNTVHGVIEYPTSQALFFTDSWESFRFANRKGYKGDNNPDIKSYDPKTKKFTQYTDYIGKDLWPTIDNQGKVYFVSDRDNGQYNLYALDKQTQLTAFDISVKNPQVSANGEKIVFEKDYQLYTYNVQTQKTDRVKIKLYQNDKLKTEQDFNINGKITAFDVSPDGKKFAFVSRGELFISDTKGKFIRKINVAPESRVMEVKWLKDNKTLLYNRTSNGWLNLFKMSPGTSETEDQLTNDEANNRSIKLNNDRTEALYLAGRSHIKLIDLDTFKSRTVVTDEFWGFENSQPRFSPDGNYIVYTAYRNFEQDLFVINILTNQVTPLTKSGISETSPFWSPDGKYIYFSCDRFNPSYPRGVNNAKIYRFALEKYMEPFKSNEWDQLFKDEDKKDKDKDKPKEKEKIAFDLDNLTRRWEKVSPDAGNQADPYVLNQKDETIALYISNHDGEKPNLWKTTQKPFEPSKTQKIDGAEIEEIAIAAANDKYYLLVDGKIGELDLNANKFNPIAMSFAFRRNLKAEFNQMFHELWAGLEENFYDDQFHGVDWRKIKEKYKQFLPFIRSRANLRTLIADMLGELNSSHLGFTSNGTEEKTFYTVKSMEPGLLFDESDPYKVIARVNESPVDKKGIDIQPGDRLIEVNGKKIDPTVNREYYFTAPSLDSELSMTFLRKKDKTETPFTVKIHPVAFNTFKQNLYDEWIRGNKERVDAKSKNRIAYIHMKDMGDEELDNFYIRMGTEGDQRDGLILDLRYNNGGNVHDAVLNFLSRRPYMVWKYRGGKFACQPTIAPMTKPIVLLINESSLSDAELTATGFKELKLGKIIGTETYRWLIFTSGKLLVDGSFYRLPSWGCYSLDKKNIETNGVKPDVYIKNTFPDRLNNNDPQLDAAIAEIMNQLK